MVQELIEAGLRHHQAGRLQEAKTLYEQALTLQPRHPDALHLAGVVALQAGDAERAVALIQRALEVQPENPGFHANLAQAWLALQRVADAHAAFLRAATLAPRDPQHALGAANCLALQGNAAEAERQLRKIARDHPGYALAWYNLGKAVREQGRHQEAADLYRRAVELDPALFDAHLNLGGALHALERFDEAERAYRRCLALQPDAMAGYCNLASVLNDRGRFAEAAAVCERGIARSREAVDLHLVLGAALTYQGRLIPALAAFRAAARLAPDNARAAGAYGGALTQTGQHEEGLEWLERALKLQPESPGLRHAIAGARLAAGEWRRGWAEYESRPARQSFIARHPGFNLASKLPASLPGKKICLLREQGLGDELFFLRFAAALKPRGAEITYRANAKLASMLARVPVLDRVIPEHDPLPAADLNLLVGDLPHALGGADFPPPLALAPRPGQLQDMKRRLAALGPPPYLGVTWRAGTAPEDQRGASWSLHKQIPLQPLGAALRGVNGTFLALQRLPKPGEIEELAACLARPVHDFTALNEDLEAMLALLALVDDYIGVSNTNMHLRAGTGRTARVLAPRPAEWRWMAEGDESPWFPGFRVYRQGVDGDWDAAFKRLAEDLKTVSGER